MKLLEKYRFQILLSSLLLLILFIPLVKDFSLISVALSLTLTYILLSCILVLSRKRSNFYIGFSLAAPFFLCSWIYVAVPSRSVEMVSLIFGILLFIYVTFTLLYNLLTEKQVSLDIIFAALASFILLGLTFSLIFELIENVQPDSFTGLAETGTERRFRFIYYSFITLTTLGYGDITPVSAIAQSWTVLEAILGQFFLVVVVSGLVGLFISRAR